MLNEPAVDKAFFGREEILSVLEKRVSALKDGYRQNVALTGQMLSGKSSILHQFLYTLKDRSLIPIYVEVFDEPFASFADKFIATLLYNYLLSCELESEKDLPTLIKKAEPIIPHTIYAIKKVRTELSKKNYSNAYARLLNLTSTIKKETGKSCVVILDEFHNLDFFKIKKPYLHFGKIIMIQKDTMYIVSSSQKNTIKKILSEKLSLLYGNFEIIEVSGFDSVTARSFLKQKLQHVAMPESHIDYLIEFTDRNPFYLNVISKKIVELTNSARTEAIGEDIVIDAFIALIYNTSGTINQYYTNSIMSLLEKGLREDCLDILIALAHGFNTLKDIAKWSGKKGVGGLSVKISKLIDLDMVYKNGVFYEVHDKVFKFWLKTVYHKRKTSLVDDVVSQRNDFKVDVKIDIDEYLEDNRKDIDTRIKEFLLLFRGETVEIEKKGRKLPRFIDIATEKRENYIDLVCRRQSEKPWIFRLYKNGVDEMAILDLIKQYHALRDKVGRKICIALGGIEANALLLAKEKNIWIWNLENINSILRLYKKHNLIYR